MVQLCIKEDTEVRNYSNCASCHNSNMAMHMLFLINQETATFASAPSCILATGENNLTKLVTTQKQKKMGLFIANNKSHWNLWSEVMILHHMGYSLPPSWLRE